MRVLHFSDVHLRAPAVPVPVRDWLGKRLIGGANLLLGRRHHFDDAPAKVRALDAFRREQGIDLVVLQGGHRDGGSAETAPVPPDPKVSRFTPCAARSREASWLEGRDEPLLPPVPQGAVDDIHLGDPRDDLHLDISATRTEKWIPAQGPFAVENYAQGAYTVALSLSVLTTRAGSDATWIPGTTLKSAEGAELEVDMASMGPHQRGSRVDSG
jgi:hypothetical protein